MRTREKTEKADDSFLNSSVWGELHKSKKNRALVCLCFLADSMRDWSGRTLFLSSISSSLLPSHAHDPALTSSVLPACQVSSSLAHLSPTPVWTVSSRKRGQDAVISSLSRVLSHWVATSHSLPTCCLPSGEPELPQRLCYRRGQLWCYAPCTVCRKLLFSLLWYSHTAVRTHTHRQET